MKFERGSNRPHSAQNLLSKRLWICRKADYALLLLLLLLLLLYCSIIKITLFCF